MQGSYARLDRALARYRLIFRVSTGAALAGLLLTALSAITFVIAPDRALVASGLFLVSMGGLNAYKSVLSTMRLIEADARSW
jgi:hypothetical protein